MKTIWDQYTVQEIQSLRLKDKQAPHYNFSSLNACVVVRIKKVLEIHLPYWLTSISDKILDGLLIYNGNKNMGEWESLRFRTRRLGLKPHVTHLVAMWAWATHECLGTPMSSLVNGYNISSAPFQDCCEDQIRNCVCRRTVNWRELPMSRLLSPSHQGKQRL